MRTKETNMATIGYGTRALYLMLLDGNIDNIF